MSRRESKKTVLKSAVLGNERREPEGKPRQKINGSKKLIKEDLMPTEHLIAAGKMYPNAWKLVDTYRQSRGIDLPNWPEWCFLPIAAWYAIVCDGNDVSQLSVELVADVGRLAAIGIWRYSQGIYRFDNEVYAAISDTVPKGELPSAVLYRLPEWCVYIETPKGAWGNAQLYGFWCHLEWDANTKRHELRILLNCEAGLIGVPIHIGKWTLTEAVDRSIQESIHQAKTVGVDFAPGMDAVVEIAKSLYSVVSLVLYLCSDEPEIDDEGQPGSSPARPQPKRTKGVLRLFPADKPRIWEVGKHLGKQLRDVNLYNEDETGKRIVKPHLRRAHWHGFWLGPRDGERKFRYKWLPPMLVSGTQDQD